MIGIITYYIEEKCSKYLSVTMLEVFNTETKAKTNLTMAIVKSLAVLSELKPVVEGYNLFEGYSPIILRAWNIFKKLNSSYNFDKIESNIGDTIDIVLLMLQSVEQL